MQKKISAPKIFTGHNWLTNHAIITADGAIKNVIPLSKLTQGEEVKIFNDCFIVPPFIDAQVYGAAGKLLAAYPSAETLQLMNEEFLRQGTVLFLPTIATNTLDVFKKCIDAVREYWNKNGKGVHGLHLEGPWINDEKSGAHVKELIHAPTMQEVKNLMDYGKDVIKMITMAPEVCSDEVIGLILSYNIIISAGHSNANYIKAIASFDKGITKITHLYNAMSSLNHRQPGLVGAAFNHQQVMASIIPDGHHVDYAAISIAKKIMGKRLFAITDAVTETNTGHYQHQLEGDKYECNGVLSGSALSMHKAFLNLVNHVGIDVGEALRMCSLYPAQALECGDKFGKIAPGYPAQLIVLNKQLEIASVITS